MTTSKYRRSKVLKAILVDKQKVVPACREHDSDRSTVYDWIRDLLNLDKDERLDLRVTSFTEEEFNSLFKKWTSKKKKKELKSKIQ